MILCKLSLMMLNNLRYWIIINCFDICVNVIKVMNTLNALFCTPNLSGFFKEIIMFFFLFFQYIFEYLQLLDKQLYDQFEKNKRKQILHILQLF